MLANVDPSLRCYVEGHPPEETVMMSDVLSFTEIGRMGVELLPARTLLSLFNLDPGDVIVSDACASGQTSRQGLTGADSATQAVCVPGSIIVGH